MSSIVSAVAGAAAQHPYVAATVGTGIAVAAAPVIIMAPVLAIAGFGPGGIALGSVAAGVQAGIGNVAAGSLFATLTSAGMGGAGAAAVGGAVSAVGGAVAGSGALAGAASWWYGK